MKKFYAIVRIDEDNHTAKYNVYEMEAADELEVEEIMREHLINVCDITTFWEIVGITDELPILGVD